MEVLREGCRLVREGRSVHVSILVLMEVLREGCKASEDSRFDDLFQSLF